MIFSRTVQLIDSMFQSPRYCRLLMLLSGGIYPLAFAPFEIWPLAIVSMILLLLGLYRGTALTPFKLGFYWGLGAFSIGASWVYVSIHEFGHVPAFGAALLTLIFVAYLALFKGFFGWLCHWLIVRSQESMLVLIAPVIWLISEYLQAFLLGGFPWLLAGYSQIDSPLASLASWLGVYGISWFLVSISACLALLLADQRKRIYWQSLLVLLSVVLLGYFDNSESFNHRQETADQSPQNLVPSPKDSISVALVQPNISQEKKWDRRYFADIVDILFLESRSLWDADIIVWPEGAIPAYAHQVTDILQDARRKAASNDSNLILGIPEYNTENKQSYVAMLALGKQEQVYHKQVLVPFGEYVPFEEWLRGAIKFLDLPMSGFTPAKLPQSAIQLSRVSLIPAICYEIVYPQIIRDLVVRSDPGLPRVIVTISNDAWFGDSFGPYQHMEMARMRALELGLPLIRSTNDGITAIVDYRGDVLESLPRYQQGSLRHELSLANRMTLYRQYGNWGIWLLCCVSGLVVIWSIYLKRGKK